MYPILSTLDCQLTRVFSWLSNLDFKRVSLAYLKSDASSSSGSIALVPSLALITFRIRLSGTGAYLSFFLFFIDISTQSGMVYHSSFDTFASYLFKSTNFPVIELSTKDYDLSFASAYFLFFSPLSQSLFSQKSYASSACLSSSSRFPLAKRAPFSPSQLSNWPG